MNDPVDRQAVKEWLAKWDGYIDAGTIARMQYSVVDIPSAQHTLHGYNIEHLELIARVLQKEDLPPERVVEALTDTGRIVAIVIDEFEETLRRSVRNIGRRTDEANNRKE